MSQARERHSRFRDSGQRQPSYVNKSPPRRQDKPYVKKPSAQVPAQTASIFKTRSFQFLVDSVGAENIALGLDSTLNRVAELMKGERFTPETAFHMETTLGLPHGFFDQPYPALAPETIARLKSPLDFVQADAEPEVLPKTFQPSSASETNQPLLKDRLPEEPEMPKKAAGGSSTLAQNSQATPAKQSAAHSPREKSTAKVSPSEKASGPQSLALNDSAAIQNIRRANLHVLTTRNGSKARLGAVMTLTGSNMAHRLHGKKRMDNAEANRFTERLGLPTGWLDTPRSEAEIPESVSQLLLPASRGRASILGKQASTLVDQDPPVSANVSNEKLATGTKASETEASEKEALVVSEQNHANVPTPAIANQLRGENNTPRPVAPEQTAIAAVPPQLIPRPFTSVTSLENLVGIEPVAEALIKTLAGKARTGRLDEMKALELLQQAVLL
jgi:hypothetical protein